MTLKAKTSPGPYMMSSSSCCNVAQLEGVEPLASPDDCLLAEEIAKADPKVQEQLKLRGVTDVSLVACDPWSG